MLTGANAYGEQVRLARKKKGLTQAQLGEKLGVSKQYVCDLEYERREPGERVALAISSVLNVQWHRSDALLRARITQLEEVLRACRKPIICSVFGMPDEEVHRLVTLIDTAVERKV